MKETRKKDPVPPRPPLRFRPLRLTWSLSRKIYCNRESVTSGQEWPPSTFNFVKLISLVNFYASKIYIQVTVRWVARCVWKAKREWECISDWDFRLPSFELWIPTSISEFRLPNYDHQIMSDFWVACVTGAKSRMGEGKRPKDQDFSRILSVKWDF